MQNKKHILRHFFLFVLLCWGVTSCLKDEPYTVFLPVYPEPEVPAPPPAPGPENPDIPDIPDIPGADTLPAPVPPADTLPAADPKPVVPPADTLAPEPPDVPPVEPDPVEPPDIPQDPSVTIIPESVLPPEIREELSRHIPIYEGGNPPDIDGQYLCEPTVLEYAVDYVPGMENLDWAPIYFCFSGDEYRETAEGSTAYANHVVVGSGDCFTAYFVSFTEMNDSLGSTTTTSTLISGRITNEGIADFKYAFIMLDKNDPGHNIMGINNYRVFKDGNGLAENCVWMEAKRRRGAGTVPGVPHDKAARPKINIKQALKK